MFTKLITSVRRALGAAVPILLVSAAFADAGKVRVRLRAVQPGVGEPVAVRAIVVQSNGEVLPGEWGDSSWPPVSIRGKAITPEMVLELPTGPTTLLIGKGPDYLPSTIVTNLAPSTQTYTLECTLQPILNLYEKGWRAGDAHIHFFHGDGQIFRTPEEAYAICAAGGLNFASLAGEHFGAPSLTGEEVFRAWRPYESTDCKIWLGAESPKNAWGHHVSILYDPWAIQDVLPYQVGMHAVHRQGGVCYPVHPDRNFPDRSFNGDYTLFPLNNHLKFFPIEALAGHLLDAWSGVSDEPANERLLAPYFRLLAMGYKIPLLADSDFCMDRVNNEQKGAGFWLNYFQLEGHAVTQAAVCEAIRKGRVMSTTGPLVLFQIDDAISGDILPADGAERTIRIQANHRFNPWTLGTNTFAQSGPCQIERIDLIRNGTVLRSWTTNTQEVQIAEVIHETEESFYMVRVLGNEGVWMAGYASPIYFSTNALPQRRPEVFKMLVNGRLYDAASGNALTGSVSCVRYGQTNWTIPTDSAGLFRAKVPIDAELIARDSTGRTLSRNLLHHEPAYAFCNYLPERHPDKAAALDEFQALISEVTWEFPIGFVTTDSYVRQQLDRDIVLDDLIVLSAPERLPAKDNAELVMLLTDKTQVQPGDLINYGLLWRAPAGGTNNDDISIGCYAWDPNHPRVYTRYGTLLDSEPRPVTIPLGNDFFLASGSIRVPSWAANSTPTTGALRLSAAIRRNGAALEDANVIIPVGPTRRELLVNTLWDGAPATWGDSGHGPCGFFRESLKARYPDYRELVAQLKHPGGGVRLAPKQDTAHAPDADDALFTEQHYYDAQCEPEFRNVPFRDPVRPQPASPGFNSLPVVDPPDTTAPEVALLEPRPKAEIQSPVSFFFHANDTGLSHIESTLLKIDGKPIATNFSGITLDLAPGPHTWQVQATDSARNEGSSELRAFTVVAPQTSRPPVFTEIAPQETGVRVKLATTPNRTYIIEQAFTFDDWRLLLRTNAPESVLELFSTPASPAALYRARIP